MFLLQSFLAGNLFFQLQKAEGHEASFHSESCAFCTALVSVYSELEVMLTQNGRVLTSIATLSTFQRITKTMGRRGIFRTERSLNHAPVLCVLEAFSQSCSKASVEHTE